MRKLKLDQLNQEEVFNFILHQILATNLQGIV